MKSRTSFFNPTALKKDIFRYAPLWALYLIGMMLVLVGDGGYTYYDHYARSTMDDLIKAFGIVNICYACLSGLMLFGDLYNTKMCYSLHAMPIRRESWLVTHLVSGLLFSLVPNVIASLYLMLVLENYWFLALTWLLAVTLQYLFFFGLATVSALLTGSRFAMLAVYAGFNFISMLLFATVDMIYVPMLAGVVTNIDAFKPFSPVVELYDFKFYTFTTTEILLNDPVRDPTRTFYVYEGLADGWGYLAIISAVGLAAMAVSVWLYRIRHLEFAGDFVAFPRIKAVACVIITMCVALCCAVLGDALSGVYIVWLIVGLIVGFFGSLMLLERRLKVFRKKTFLGFAVLALVVGISLVGTACDWFGIQSWTPKASHVQSVTVSNYRSSGYYYEIYGGGHMASTLTDPAEIEELIDAHEDILNRLDENANNRHRVVLTYKLKSGFTVIRSYYAPASGENYRIVQKYLYKPENILGFTNWQDVADKIQYMNYNSSDIPEHMYGPFLQALQTDCHNGHVVSEGKGEHYIEFAYVNEDNRYVSRVLWILDSAENTLALMKSPQMAMGYAQWEEFLRQMEDLYCNDQVVLLQDREALLIAIRQDIQAGTLQPNSYEDSDRGIHVYYFVKTPDGKGIYRDFYITPENINAWAIVAEKYA